MSGSPRRFSMVYRDIADDPIFHDDELLAWWLRLRMEADLLYPEAPTFPRRVSDETIDALVAGGHLRRINGERYRFVEVDAIAEARSERGRKMAAGRWGDAQALPVQSTSNAPAQHEHPSSNAQTMLTQTHTQTQRDVESGPESVNAREPRRRRTEVRGFTRPLGRP